MGIPSLNSAIFYNVGLYFHFNDPSTTLRVTIVISINKPHCHFERAKRVEKSTSHKYSKYL